MEMSLNIFSCGTHTPLCMSVRQSKIKLIFLQLNLLSASSNSNSFFKKVIKKYCISRNLICEDNLSDK